ncbi:GNAT family N-acetyltransferase [Sediminibacterium sp. KACHI17]|jgi:RimJ/RimL family protein N-acetyltransferase|uniref:GNAT family N-acetyltransferase n=2 Tax=Sediminibacterium sp. KACHI17 TaxID=1751071 RepID=A0AAT9GK86_9BACT
MQDAQALAAVANNRNIWNQVRDFFPSPYTVSDAIQWIGMTEKESPALNFAILYDGQVVGGVGLVTKQDIYRKNIEIGYYIGEAYWGKGIATEACKLICSYVEQQMDVVRIEASTFHHNKASMRVLLKNGFYLEAIKQKAIIKNNQLLDEYLWVKRMGNKG